MSHPLDLAPATWVDNSGDKGSEDHDCYDRDDLKEEEGFDSDDPKIANEDGETLVTVKTGALFSAPQGAVLIRMALDLFTRSSLINVQIADAVNCQGKWGAGIAMEFKRRVS
jgi:hypothetical protein